MILCPNGHRNRDGTTYCQTCKTYIDSDAPYVPEPQPDLPPAPEPPGPPVVSIEPASTAVTVGQEATVRVRIRNPATAPDDFVVEVTGAAAAWSSVIPWTSPIGPGAEAIVSVAFRPPASSGMAAGTMPFGVNVTPTRAPGGAVSAEGTLEVRLAEVAPVLQASLDPVNSEGRTHVEHVLSVWNPTQNAVQAELSATDEAGFLAFDFEPSTLLVSAGGGASAQLRVRPRKRIVFRRKKVRPFRALVTADGSQLRLEGSMLQRRYIPLWAMPIFGASLLVLIAAALVVILAIVVIVSLALD